MTPIGSLHEDIVDRLMDWSVRNTSRDEIRVRAQNSIGLPALQSAPEPDLVWVRQREYASGRPTAQDVLLIVEVADSSLAYDRGEKAALYARAGIADYWVVNIPDRAIEVRRNPAGEHDASLTTFQGEEEIRPLCDGSQSLHPNQLFES
jgi:Uma2 family endonuclease